MPQPSHSDGRSASCGTWVALVLRGPSAKGAATLNENDHPKGALLFMLVYLALLAFMWTNLYLKLWTR
jgi:hypothetical protein